MSSSDHQEAKPLPASPARSERDPRWALWRPVLSSFHHRTTAALLAILLGMVGLQVV
ncbi:hypothetical protein OLX02_04830 [Novosphingobium sp. KCTC 2891]|uniref:hypothetical protein n=1 Tax=Novosphingobium sp. KCTC 2891 TaxID=2989730 RepID=UPI002222E90B|nr:hypothetical protein [Novosphingobium sp. KCTC 2891]MCW1382138.1 hypothetical protein [Novosphingobium sp. KCTC 2891]